MAATPSFLASFVKMLLFMLLCGIVGPIFLVIGLVGESESSGPDSSQDWLIWWGIAITALDVVIAWFMARSRYRKDLKLQRLGVHGRSARADILSMEETGIRINDQPVVKLRLRIHGESVAPFEVEERKTVPMTAIPLLHRGGLAVVVDPETQDYEIDWHASAQLAGSAPASYAAPGGTRAERLAELDELMRSDLLTTEEYEESRKRILGEL